MLSIDRVNTLDINEFNRLYYLQNKPVVWQRGVESKPYFRRWSLDYFKDQFGSRLVDVNYSEKGIYNFNVKGLIQKINIPFSEAADFFSLPGYSNKSYYLQQAPINKNFPELLQEIEDPEWILDTDIIQQLNLWIGGAGCVTPLHYDMAPNFLVQITGRKDLIMFAPSDSQYLYPSRQTGGIHLSEIDIENFDEESFPLFSQATPYHCILEPGDILFIPPGWWHHVRSLNMCISINYWWNRLDIVDGIGMGHMPVERICEVIQSFQGKGVTADHTVLEGEKLLVKAVLKGYANVVEALLKMGGNPNTISLVAKPGVSALELSLEQGNTVISDLLFTYGAISSNPVQDSVRTSIQRS